MATRKRKASRQVPDKEQYYVISYRYFESKTRSYNLVSKPDLPAELIRYKENKKAYQDILVHDIAEGRKVKVEITIK